MGDTAAYDPTTKTVTHYKGWRYFLVNLMANGMPGIEQWAVGQKGQPGKEGTWRDAEDDGNLSGNPIAQGAGSETRTGGAAASDIGLAALDAVPAGWDPPRWCRSVGLCARPNHRSR